MRFPWKAASLLQAAVMAAGFTADGKRARPDRVVCRWRGAVIVAGGCAGTCAVGQHGGLA